MYFGYDICPKCKNMLIERDESNENINAFKEYSGRRCLICGSRLVLACVGDEKIDETTYKIIINNEAILDKEELVDILKKLNISIPTVIHSDKKSIIFEGTADDVYIKINILDDTKIKYTVEPKFPFTKFIFNKVCLCSKCGSETVQKIQEEKHSKAQIIKGFYCENCNEWIIYNSFSKLQLDDKIYQLVFSLIDINNKPDCGAKKNFYTIWKIRLIKKCWEIKFIFLKKLK